MSKKKKKTVPVSGAQKLKNRVCGAAGRVFGAARRFCARAGSALGAGGAFLHKNITAFLRRGWSALPLTAVFLLLIWITYLLFGHRYLSTDFPLTFPMGLLFYLTDFSAGFISRALVGQIVSLFAPTLSVMQILAIARGAVFAVWIAEAALAAAAFRKAWLKGSPLICLLCVFFVFSPIASDAFPLFLGFLDPFNVLLAVLYLYISDTRAAPLLTPLICVPGVILHYQFILSLLPMILSVELYYVCRFKKGRAARLVSFFASLAASAAVGVYLVFFSKYHLTVDADEFYQHMCDRFSDYRSWGLFKDYFTFYIYGDYEGVNYSNPVDFVRFLLNHSLTRMEPRRLLCYAAATVPFWCVLEYFWICAFRRSEKEKKLPWLVFMLQPLVFAAGVIASTDTARWAGNAWFANFALLTVALRHDGDLLYPAAERLQKKPLLILFCAVMLAGYAVGMIGMRTYLT
jgi:hypothetical protein